METILIVSSIFLWLIVLFNVLLTCAIIRRLNTQRSSEQMVGPKRGQRAPEFTAQRLGGGTATLATFAGRKVAFVFISAHCAPCQDLLRDILPLVPAAVRKGLDIVLVSGDEMEEIQAYAEQQHISQPLLVAPRKTNTFLKDYTISSTPSFCIVSEQGIVQSAGHPSLNSGPWKSLIDSLTEGDVPVAAERR